MEARLDRSRRGLWIALGLVLLIRIPFLNQAVQGDDHTYISEAAHALVDPLHPLHFNIVFLGDEVDLRGHPHPPLNAWTLAALIAAFGEVKEIPFHAAYIVWSLIAVAAMWSLARRFSPSPLWATLLFIAVPPFVVNGNSFETDLPFLALWMASVALFCSRRFVFAAMTMALAALTSYQAVFLVPILGIWLWLHDRKTRAAWVTLLAAPLTVAGFQLFERITTGAAPAAVLTGYFATYGLQKLTAKLANAVMLAIHSCWLVFPALLPPAAILAWRKRRDPDTVFLLAWIGVFFALALVVFYAGSIRYLLPIAAPVALLASRLPTRWLAPAFAIQLALGLALAAANYQHWDGYREFARSLRRPTENHRVWIDGEWGMRYYFEQQGGVALRKTQQLRPGEFVVSSQLGSSIELNTPVAVIATADIRPSVPFRIFGLESHSGYSTVSKGFLPFEISTNLVDRLRALQVVERHPTLEYLPMDAPEAKDQIVTGIFSLEGKFRWTSHTATVVLKSPAAPAALRAEFTIHPKSRARTVRLLLDGREVASKTYSGPGAYTLQTAPLKPAGAVAVVALEVDQTFTAPPDTRDLGIVLSGIGFH
jgi:hypothetical protein